MSSFQAKDDRVQSVQLKVQEVVLRISDSIVSVSGAVVTVDLGEEISEVRAAMHCDDSAGSAGLLLIPSNNIVITKSKIKLTLTVAPAAADAIVLKFVVAE